METKQLYIKQLKTNIMTRNERRFEARMLVKNNGSNRGAELLKTERTKKAGNPEEYTAWLNALSNEDFSLLSIETTKNKPNVKHIFINN